MMRIRRIDHRRKLQRQKRSGCGRVGFGGGIRMRPVYYKRQWERGTESVILFVDGVHLSCAKAMSEAKRASRASERTGDSLGL